MKKFIRRVIKSFKRLSDANILTFGQNVTVSMAAAVTTFPTPVPSLADINAELVKYAELLQTSASRDKVQVQLKNISKFALTRMLSQLADYVNTTTTDSAALASSGFVLNKMPQPITISHPENPVLTDGDGSGKLTFKFKAVRCIKLPVPIYFRRHPAGEQLDKLPRYHHLLHFYRAYQGYYLLLSRDGRRRQQAG